MTLENLCRRGLSVVDVKECVDLINALHVLTASHEIRDDDWSAVHLYRVMLGLFDVLWKARTVVEPEEDRLWSVWEYCLESPEFREAEATREVQTDWVVELLDRLVLYATQSERGVNASSLRCAKHCFHLVYITRMDLRGRMRSLLGAKLLSLGQGRGRGRDGGRSRLHVKPLLELLRSIISGISMDQNVGASSISCTKHLLTHVLMPLHLPSEMVEWRDQVPVVQDYHEALVQCVARLVEQSRGVSEGGGGGEGGGATTTLLVQAVTVLLNTWPQGYEANTPKEVLFLHELEGLLGLASRQELCILLPGVLERVGRCIGSDVDNIRPAQRALQMFKSRAFLDALLVDLPTATRFLVPALFRGGELSWNPTINKMTGLALQALHDLDPAAFATVAEDTLGRFCRSSDAKKRPRPLLPSSLSMLVAEEKLPSVPSVTPRVTPAAPAVDPVRGFKPPAPPPQRPLHAQDGASVPVPASLRALGVGAGLGWRAGKDSGPPPVTVTGVAPWAMAGAAGLAGAGAEAGMGRGLGGGVKGGVHAVMPRSLVPVAASDAKRVGARLAAVGQKGQALMEVDEENDEEKEDGGDKSGTMEGPGERALLAFMARCLPQKASGSVVEDWNAVQAAETPTLLPGLRFHDLVFGRQLGEGAFSTVRYARHIQRGGVSGGPSSSSQSQWPEYAVKIVSGAKMSALGYHASVEREMAVLHLLAHPGVCRLVSAFRYTGNAYMVLEYAARGDLHSFVLSLGGGGKRALGHAGARFVLGEVCAALQSVHELGFSFNDLKPENVLLTGLGHVKLADFGASRPLGSEGRRRLEDSLARVGCLRNGDWREEGASAVGGVDSFPVLGRGASAAREEEELAEGTPGYLPPEVLGLWAGTGEGYSSSPGLGADAWALGCLAWFCLTGRPLFYGSRDEVLTQQQDPDHCPVLLLDPAAAVEGVEGSEEKDQRRKVHFGAEADAAAESFLGDGNTGPFLRGLLNRDPRERLSVLDASNHAYLMQGPAVGDEDECQSLRPLRLHAGTPVALPLPSSSSSTSDDNPQWARRQFSVLWAPMPPVYDILAGQDQIQGQGQGHSRGAPYRYALTTVEETQAESGAFFL